MEKLVQQLIEKQNLKRPEAIDAIRMVSAYLKKKHPEFEKLINSAVDEELKNADRPGKR